MKTRPRFGLYALVILSVVVSFLPIIWLILTSLKTTEGIYAWPPQYIPQPFTLKNYINIFTNSPELLLYVVNSFIVALGCTVLALTFGGMAGYALSRLGMRRVPLCTWFPALACRIMVSPVLTRCGQACRHPPRF